MLRIHISTSAAQVKKYLGHAPSQEAYYSEGQEFAGFWGGKAAKKLGLEGRVDKKAFDQLCDNINPLTGERLTARNSKARRPGFDVNFNAPKSLSLAYFWLKDERIMKAYRRAINETMLDIEKEAGVRVRNEHRNQDDNKITGSIVFAEYIHFTGRPVDGVPDPHLHSHMYVPNCTFDEDAPKHQWKALQILDIKRRGHHFEARFHARLRNELKEMGYPLRRVGKSFEIEGIDRELIEKFSRRQERINAEAEKRGITNASEKSKLAALTREKKVKELSIPELEPIWWGRLTQEEREALDGLKTVLRRSQVRTVEKVGRSSRVFGTRNQPLIAPEAHPKEAAKAHAIDDLNPNVKAMEYAINHLFYTRSIVTREDLITEALTWGSDTTIEGVEAALKSFPLQRLNKNGIEVLTTPEVVLEENRIIERCKNGRWKHPTLNAGWRIQAERLNSQQREAVFHVLNSQDFVTGIIGKAGTGKTTTLLEISTGIEAAGKKVMAFAPSASAARGTLRKSGFPQADTISSLLKNPKLQEQARGAVWFVDESGLLSTPMTDELLRLAERLDARVVMVGDPGQHRSVERGDAFRLLQNHGEMSVAMIDIVQRQKGAYKEAVELAAQNRYGDAFHILEQMNAFHEIWDIDERYAAIAKDYIETLKEKKSALLIAPTHEECDRVTESVRQWRKAAGEISDGREWNILRSLPWSPAERSYAPCYEPGMVIKVNGHTKGFRLGEQMEVVDVEDGAVYVRREKGEVKQLPIWESNKFNVYEKESIEICKGDRIRVTLNSRTEDGHSLNNGDTCQVERFDKDGNIILKNGLKLKKDFAFLEHGYADTSYAAQGATVDVIYIAHSAQLSKGAGDSNQVYTALSRGRDEPRIYVDDIEEMKESASRIRTRDLAMDVISEQDRARIIEAEVERNRELTKMITTLDSMLREREEAKELGKATEREFSERTKAAEREIELSL